MSGYQLGVNPFNQPGVEAYKQNMFALLGKPGYEDKKRIRRPFIICIMIRSRFTIYHKNKCQCLELYTRGVGILRGWDIINCLSFLLTYWQ